VSNVAMVMAGPGEAPVATDRPMPEPGPGEAVVRVRGSNLNYHDLVNLMGLIDGPWPRVPMTDGAGEVAAVGDGVRSLAVGDRVVGAFHPDWGSGRLTRANGRATPGDTTDGWLQQHMLFPAEALVAAPPHLDDAEASTLVCAGTTAWNAVDSAGLRAGDVVVTQGTGGVSCFVVQLAKARGAKVILTSSSDEKLEIGRTLGADHLVNYRTSPDWERTVRELTGGDGADLVVDLGGAETLARSVKATRSDGHVAIVGVLSGFGMAQFPVSDAMVRQIRLFGVSVGSVTMLADLVRAVSATELRPHVSHTFDWTDLESAKHVQQEQQHIGKVAITIP
jgi:NADPH:quinone reductase-like Zn-dependent oxidoreductase